jgi:ATP-dependent helicase/nuclease subunit A
MIASTISTAIPTPPPDESERRRIHSDLGATLFVEAGAGAGKTSSLVARIVNLVRSGVPITGIAAITFTEKAAAELRSRTRQRLEAEPGPETEAALARLDHAPIGTLHSFARRILFDFPIDAGLPPGSRCSTNCRAASRSKSSGTISSTACSTRPNPDGGPHRRWSGVRRVVRVRRLRCRQGRAPHGRRLPGQLGSGERPRRSVRSWAPPARHRGDRSARRPDRLHGGPARRQAERHRRRTRGARGGLRSQSLRTRLEALAALDAKCGHWGELKVLPGAKGKWTAAFGAAGEDALESLRADEVELGRLANETLEDVKRHRRLLLGAIMGRFVLDAATDRATSGQLEFHDLLVLARRLLADHPHVRRLLHERYVRVLLDEFQDTDPIQLEIAVRLTADPDDPAQAVGDRGVRAPIVARSASVAGTPVHRR